MNRIEIKDRFAEMWKLSRSDAGYSQDYMAKSLGVSKKTVQNWEAGFSSPSQEMGFLWFEVCGLQPLPYYMRVIYPGMADLQPSCADSAVEDQLISVIKSLPADTQRKMLYVMFGSHGSSPVAVLEEFCANLQTPLRDRLMIADVIANNYQLALEAGNITNPENIQPNLELLREAVRRGRKAVVDGNNAYNVVDVR